MLVHRILILLGMWWFYASSVDGQQLLLIVDEIPANTPDDSPLFLAADINNWDPGNADFRLTKVNGRHQIKLDLIGIEFRFKVTRGNWETVESDKIGMKIDNRVFKVSKAIDTLYIKVAGWEDFRPNEKFKFIVKDLSENNHSDRLFITGAFNSWNPGESRYVLRKNPAGHLEVEIPHFKDSLEYKYTRGSWQTVEGDQNGNIRENRWLFPEDGQLIKYDTVVSWEDFGIGNRYTFIISDIPANTPKDAQIYITGNFNDWDPGASEYRMIKRDGGYQITIDSEQDTLYYKFTRGEFSSVEGRFNGLARPNRITIHEKTRFPLKVRIHTWEDLSGEWFNIYTISLIVPVIIGILIISALGGLRNSQPANSILRILLLIVCVSLIFRVLPYYRELFTAFPQLIVLSDLIYFLFPVVIYLYLLRLFGVVEGFQLKHGLHFLPFAVHFFLYLPFFLIERQTFIDHIVNLEFRWIFRAAGFLGFLFSSVYWYKCIQLQKAYQRDLEANISYDIDLNYTRTILLLGGVNLFFWFSLFTTGLIGSVFDLEVLPFLETTTDLTWFFFSLNIYLFGYFAIQKPELFKIESKPLTKSQAALEVTELDQLKAKLDGVMKTSKPYLNDQLSLNQLADHVGESIHTLSRVINEGYEMNFYEYINMYRVEEFIIRAKDPSNQNKTYLGLAIEVGFNSKSTFNRSFKKAKGETPREFFKSHQQDQILAE